jgi:hypothetical protein
MMAGFRDSASPSLQDIFESGSPLGQGRTEDLERYGHPRRDFTSEVRGDSSKELWVSVRRQETPEDYKQRQGWDRKLAVVDPGRFTFFDDARPGESGYSVRYRNLGSVHFEIVQHRREEMVIVRVSQAQIPKGTVDKELVRCEKEARAHIALMRVKLGWGR